MNASTQTDRVFSDLKADILACRLRPSQKIKINEITKLNGVSPGAAREALSRLVSEGMVEAKPQRGFTVAPISRHELNDLTETRILLETQCLRQSIENGSIEWEADIVSAHHRLSLIPERLDTVEPQLNPDWSAAHTIFHTALVSACGNACLIELRDLLYARSERYRYWSVSLSAGTRTSRDAGAEHRVLMQAALDRDIDAACTNIAKHFQRTTSELIRISNELNREIA